MSIARLSLISLSAGRGPPPDDSWNKVPPSDVDLWNWIMIQPRGSVVTVLYIGKDGIGVSTDLFEIFVNQTQARGIEVQLDICHDVDTQSRNHDLQLSLYWVYSITHLGRYFAAFWLIRLASNEPNRRNGSFRRYASS